MKRALLLTFLLGMALNGCAEPKGEYDLKYELRWCADGEETCDVEDLYVAGGFFEKLKDCNNAIKHLKYYGVTVGGDCFAGEEVSP